MAIFIMKLDQIKQGINALFCRTAYFRWIKLSTFPFIQYGFQDLLT